MARERKKSEKRPTKPRTTARSSAGGLPSNFRDVLEDLKARIRSAQVKAVVAINRELILLYWGIGQEILIRQDHEGWGAKVIDRLADELRRAFPAMKGLSPRNIKYMRALAAAFPDASFVQEVLAQITWYHALTLMEKVKDPDVREWYIRKTIENGWSRNVLALQIDGRLHERQGKAVTNFE
jgi:predicted nuclease of restriction endonuclease-like (RecB) superfamily